MKIVHFSELGSNTREEMKGARWILLEQDDIKSALSALMFAELDGVLALLTIENHLQRKDCGNEQFICSSFQARKTQKKFD